MTMKLTIFVVVTLLAIFGQFGEGNIWPEGPFRPLKVNYEDVMDRDNVNLDTALVKELTNVGMISITNMPESFRLIKQEVLALTVPCSLASSASKTHIFSDGTQRRTMATHTTPGEERMQSIDHGNMNHDGFSSCRAFDQASVQFRSIVNAVTQAFANRVSELFVDVSQPILQTEDGFEYKTIHDIVNHGEHLEHYHSYQRFDENTNSNSEPTTIEWHTDQGLFLVFTPGMLVQQDEDGQYNVGDITEGFYIELSDGSQVEIHFDDDDDLVVLLGDGVNQYVNPKMYDASQQLRAVPHALKLSKYDDNSMVRVWYGRMVLPPSDAMHPQHQETFGHLRQVLIDASSVSSNKNNITQPEKEVLLGLGCSSPTMYARQLEESSCEEGTLFCWHRCMSLEEYGVSEEICSEQDLDLWCINPRSQLWDNTHGDWFPGCIDASTAENGTEYPKLPTYPRNNDTCTEAAYASFIETNSAEYDHTADLGEGGVLMWSVDGDRINGMLSYNGLFGYVALGFAGNPDFPGGNAMHGAIIIMATPSDIYSPVTGFDFSSDPVVGEYIIDINDKAFRHWMTPVSLEARQATTTTSIVVSSQDSYSVQESDCFTTMTFNTAGIFNTTFNITGVDELIWAANGVDMFAGYHGPSRGRISVEWTAGKVALEDATEEVHDDDGHDDDVDHDHHDGDSGVGMTATNGTLSIFVVLLLLSVSLA